MNKTEIALNLKKKGIGILILPSKRAPKSLCTYFCILFILILQLCLSRLLGADLIYVCLRDLLNKSLQNKPI